MNRVVHPIEQESFRRLRARLDTSRFPPLTRAVVDAEDHDTTHHIRLSPATPPGPTLELSILARPALRPVDLGLGPDDRRVSALVHRVRIHANQR